MYSIGAVGFLAAVSMNPSVLKILLKEGWKQTKRDYKRTVNESTSRLLRTGLIKFEETPKGKFIRLTEKGKKEFEMIESGRYSLKKPKKWDGKWRMIIFDIKEKRKTIREKLRETLGNIGFVKLQNSVWVYPYDCEDFIILLKSDFMIGKEVLYVIADKIENDKSLKNTFNLS